MDKKVYLIEKVSIMKLKIKEEYKEWSIGEGRNRPVKLKNLDPTLWEYHYLNGYSEFFEEVIIEKKETKKEVILNNISKEDYIIWDNEKNEPLEDLDIVYHYTSIVELFNDDNFGLKGNEEIRCVAELPLKWQKRINQAIEDCK